MKPAGHTLGSNRDRVHRNGFARLSYPLHVDRTRTSFAPGIRTAAKEATAAHLGSADEAKAVATVLDHCRACRALHRSAHGPFHDRAPIVFPASCNLRLPSV